MSINLMSAIFETEFFDLQDGKGNVTKASTAKLVLLAMADHANDEGEGSYPSIDRLCRKTALSPQTIRNTFDALKHNGIISLTGLSKHGTNNHTINTKSFPKAIGKEVTVLTLYPLEGSNQSPGPLQPVTSTPLTVRPESSLTVNESPLPPAEIEKANRMVDAILANTQPQEDHTALTEFERVFGFGALPWHCNTVWTKFAKWVVKQHPAGWFAEYVRWRAGDGKYAAYGNKKIRENPEAFMDTGYPEYEASKMYRKDAPAINRTQETMRYIEEREKGAVPPPPNLKPRIGGKQHVPHTNQS